MSPALAQVNGPGPSPANLFDTVLNLPVDEAITGGVGESIGGVSGQTTQLNVSFGGEVGGWFGALSGSEVNISGGTVSVKFEAHSGSEVNISGGTVGRSFEAFSGSEVNISGGAVDDGFDAHSGSEVNISGGTVGDSFDADFGSVVNISGGKIGDSFDADSGSEVNISGGAIGDSFDADSGSEVNISGGTFGRPFRAKFGSDVELIGGEFRLNGADFSGNTITLVNDDVFTGTLADGSSFIFSHAADTSTNVTLTTVALPASDLDPIVISAPVISGPSGVRARQTLTLQSGGSLRNNFAVVDATLNVEGGVLGARAEASQSLVNISGGEVGGGFDAYSGSLISISGGEVGGDFTARSGSEVNISGGTFGEPFGADSGSVVNIFGSEFFIDDEELDFLVPEKAFTITDRNVKLSGLLADGEFISYYPNSFASSNRFDYCDPNATLTVTLVSQVVLGDVNLDGVVDFLDINPFIAVLSAETFQAEADCDENGVVNFLDINYFIGILSGN